MDLRKFELPYYLKIEENILYKLEDIIRANEDISSKVLLVTSGTPFRLYGDLVEHQLRSVFKEVNRIIIENNHLDSSFSLANFMINNDYTIIVGMGGGKTLDVCKYAAFMSKTKFISIPTAIAHDGIASPIAVLKCQESTKSLGCSVPAGIIVDLEVISKAPIKLIKAGIGDTLSNLTAIKDWKLAFSRKRAEIDDFALLLSTSAFNSVLNYENKDLKNIGFLKTVAEALILSGLAMNLAGSSRPCSGSEHLISHAMDKLDKNNPHGIQVAIGTIISSYLHGIRHNEIVSFLKSFEIPTTLEKLNISYEEFIWVMKNAKETRPGRYTILDETDLSEKSLEIIYEDVFCNEI